MLKCPWQNYIEESDVWFVGTGQILLWCITRSWLCSIQRTVDNALITAARHTDTINEQTSMYCFEILKCEVINYEIIPQTHDWGNFHPALYSAVFFPLMLKPPHVGESDLKEKAGWKGVYTLLGVRNDVSHPMFAYVYKLSDITGEGFFLMTLFGSSPRDSVLWSVT